MEQMGHKCGRNRSKFVIGVINVFSAGAARGIGPKERDVRTRGVHGLKGGGKDTVQILGGGDSKPGANLLVGILNGSKKLPCRELVHTFCLIVENTNSKQTISLTRN